MKIRCRKSKKLYLGNKNVYEYEQRSICIPSRYHKDVEPFLGNELDMILKAEKNKVVIVLESRKKVSADRK